MKSQIQFGFLINMGFQVQILNCTNILIYTHIPHGPKFERQWKTTGDRL